MARSQTPGPRPLTERGQSIQARPFEIEFRHPAHIRETGPLPDQRGFLLLGAEDGRGPPSMIFGHTSSHGLVPVGQRCPLAQGRILVAQTLVSAASRLVSTLLPALDQAPCIETSLDAAA